MFTVFPPVRQCLCDLQLAAETALKSRACYSCVSKRKICFRGRFCYCLQQTSNLSVSRSLQLGKLTGDAVIARRQAINRCWELPFSFVIHNNRFSTMALPFFWERKRAVVVVFGNFFWETASKVHFARLCNKLISSISIPGSRHSGLL